jgi:hypothetical protein
LPGPRPLPDRMEGLVDRARRMHYQPDSGKRLCGRAHAVRVRTIAVDGPPCVLV